MRRKDREITDIQEIAAIMRKCDVCRLALNDGDYPYILPLNFGMELDGEAITLYFHSALEGYKVELFERNPKASFEMDCGHALQYFKDKGYCTFAYESVIGRGNITILEEEEKVASLEKLMDQYHPGQSAYFSHGALPRTMVYKLTVEEVRGKRKKLK